MCVLMNERQRKTARASIKKSRTKSWAVMREEVVVRATGSGPPKRGGGLKGQGEHTNILWNANCLSEGYYEAYRRTQ